MAIIVIPNDLKLITDRLVRCTSIAPWDGTLGAGDSISFGQPGSGADIELPPETASWGAQGDVSLADQVQVLVNPISDVSNYAIPIRVEKTSAPLLIVTLTNDSAATTSPQLEVYIGFH